jgi:hypothetical protein
MVATIYPVVLYGHMALRPGQRGHTLVDASKVNEDFATSPEASSEFVDGQALARR